MKKNCHVKKKKGTVLILLCTCSIYKRKTLPQDFVCWIIFRGDVFYSTFFIICSRFLIFNHFINFQSIKSMTFQCNRYKMKAKFLMNCLTINLPLEKQSFWISRLSSSKKWLRIQIFNYCKKCTRFPIDGIFYSFFWHISCQKQALEHHNINKFDFLTRSWWPVGLTRDSNDNFCH